MQARPSRKQHRTERKAARAAARMQPVLVDHARLAPNNSYGTLFMLDGFYRPQPFFCRDCGAPQTWSARQQKWWYETCQGSIYAIAVRCLACRIRRRQKQAEHRQRTAEGLARKAAHPVDGKAFKLEKERRAQLLRQWRAQARRSLEERAPTFTLDVCTHCCVEPEICVACRFTPAQVIKNCIEAMRPDRPASARQQCSSNEKKKP